MRHFISAIVLCVALIGFTSFLLTTAESAEEDVIMALLNSPAPPPKNPLMPAFTGKFEETFYDKENPPPDNAPIEDLIAYWTHQSSQYRQLGYNISPSPHVASRLIAEVSRDPAMLGSLINVFRGNEDGARYISDLYERTSQDPNFSESLREQMREWLMYESPYFSGELEKRSLQVGDVGEYVRNHDDLLALGRQDWNKAAPIVNQLYSDTNNPVSKIAATWALYRRAMDSGGISDADRYRDELKAVVENREATDAMRDLALDALVQEKEWPGRDDWYFSLLGDESLADLTVNGQSYTGLTTIIHFAPKNKYKNKMIELAGSSNKVIRTAAVKNLMIILSNDISESDVDIARAMVPWLSDREWCEAGDGIRSTYIRMLSKVKLADAVPGLIALLDEKDSYEVDINYNAAANAANSAAYAANYAANVAATAANTAAGVSRSKSGTVYYSNSANLSNSVRGQTRMIESTPHRMAAISALEHQADPRAAPYLRRLLNGSDGYVREMLISALVMSGGFTIPEQVAGIESLTKLMVAASEEYMNIASNAIANLGITDASSIDDDEMYEIMTSQLGSSKLRYIGNNETHSVENLIGNALTNKPDPSEELVRAVIDRITYLDKRDPSSAKALRQVFMVWKGPAVNSMLLADLKNGKADAESIIKLLAIRKELREKQVTDVYDARSGNAAAASIAACILEDASAMETQLQANSDAATAVLACARLIRAKLTVPKVIDLMQSTDQRLSLAAERYLESEDSVASRQAILARYPGKARILGATSHFSASNSRSLFTSTWLPELFNSVGAMADHMGSFRLTQFAAEEKRLQEEVIADQKILGVYSYESDQIRIYADGVFYRNLEDESRYRERPLTDEEFNYLKQYLTHYNVDELVPFISCTTECEAKQLLMVGRNGGRRVFNRTKTNPEFFAGLEKYFNDLRSEPSELKYAAGSEIANLQILFADNNNTALTVWKNGNDLRLLVINERTREKVKKELEESLEKFINDDYDGPETTGSETEISKPLMSPYEAYRIQTEARAFEGISWFSVHNRSLTGVVTAPNSIEIPPIRDSLSIQPSESRWLTAAGGQEIRADRTGLYKVSNGNLTKLSEGNFLNLVISANGRWAIGRHYDEENDLSLVRIDLTNGRKYTIDTSNSDVDRPVSFIPSVNRFLLMDHQYAHYEEDDYELTSLSVRGDLRNRQFALLDPDTGKIQKIAGEFRPLAQQTFRRLQQAGTKAHEFWAAIPDRRKNETVIGVYDSQSFGFKPVYVLPKIIFDSMQMWVDEREQRVYFVYRGHLLSAPMSKN